MASTERGKNSSGLNAKSMAYSEQAEVASLKIPQCLTTSVAFYTTFALRKFRRNFYYFSLALVERAPGLPAQIQTLDAYKALLASLDLLKQELTVKGCLQWQEIVHSLKIENITVYTFLPHCATVLKAFLAMDRFLIPAYAAYKAGNISKTELDDINNQVKACFDVFRDSLEKIMGSHQVKSDGGSNPKPSAHLQNPCTALTSAKISDTLRPGPSLVIDIAIARQNRSST